jgi:hypothetical protein
MHTAVNYTAVNDSLRLSAGSLYPLMTMHAVCAYIPVYFVHAVNNPRYLKSHAVVFGIYIQLAIHGSYRSWHPILGSI